MVFSGTLSYIFNNFKDGRLFSEVVAEARDAGYTEPDPRDDLSGTDVARKVQCTLYTIQHIQGMMAFLCLISSILFTLFVIII